MMATETDMVLDLSAKRPRLGTPSPALSTASSDGLQDHRSPAPSPPHKDPGSALKVDPVRGFLPGLHGMAMPQALQDTFQKEMEKNLAAHLPSGMRPFKMYPFEALPGASTQINSVPSMPAGFYPAAAASLTTDTMAGLSPMAGLDATLGLMSPISQLLQSRKRKIDSLNYNGSNSSVSPRPPSSSPGPSAASNSDPELQRRLSADTADPNYDNTRSPQERIDESYWERRRKNNEAAKRSRDSRRIKEEEIALRAAYLEQENLKLRAQVAILKNETSKLHYMLYNRL